MWADLSTPMDSGMQRAGVLLAQEEERENGVHRGFGFSLEQLSPLAPSARRPVLCLSGRSHLHRRPTAKS